VAQVVVARNVSTSDTRLWGVHLGRYGSRFEAERTLIQTALSEISSLEGGVRRVQPKAGGFEANFVGLTQDQADLACRRIQARDRMCFTLSP
jgi:D-alanyl-D-alanine carboxypeptidase